MLPSTTSNVPFLLDNLRDHRPHHPNVTVQYPTQRPEDRRGHKGAREAIAQTRDACPQQADHQHPLPTHPLGIRQSPPPDRRYELRGGEGPLQQARLGRDGRIRQRRVERLELVEQVRLQRGLGQRFRQAREGQDRQLTFFG